ncbi:MAG: diguanylate cyclase [Desulfobulbaceae bacterium]|nr:MAG: diguanylate cyclase [Desulfobulbaceae bacterium]
MQSDPKNILGVDLKRLSAGNRRNTEEANRFAQYSVICSAGVITMLFFGIVNLISGNKSLGIFVFTCCISLIFGWVLVYLQKAEQGVYRFNTFFFAALMVYLIYLGGDEHSKLLWIYITPSIMFFLLGRIEGSIGTFCFLLFVGLYFLMQEEIPGGHLYGKAFAGRVMLSLCIISVITYFYENLRSRYRTQMEQKNEELKVENSQRRLIEKSLRESEERYRAIYEHAAEGIVLIDFSGKIIECNPQVQRMLGYREEQLLEKDIHSLFDPENLAQIPSQLEKLKGGQTIFIERRLKTSSGDYLLCEQSGRRISDGLIILLYRDISERKIAEEALEQANLMLQQLAIQDGLTGIPNRRKFDEALTLEWQRMQREKLRLGVIIGDIDYFKQYNDHYGHQRGDECLKSVAKTLSENVHRPGDLVARYGGEEFVILLPDTTVQGCEIIAERMRAAIESLAIDHAESSVSSKLTMSFGVASMKPEGDVGPDVLLLAADKALYKAKGNGRNLVCRTEVSNGS